jgi:hypothetical protein
VKQPKRKKIKGNKVRHINSKRVTPSGSFYISAFGGGIKKKTLSHFWI